MESLENYCLRIERTALLSEWDSEKNDGLSPQNVSYGSHKKVWWRCKAGHSWQAAVYSRAHGTGCPYCGHYRILPGYNDLQTKRADIAAEWDATKNAPLTPDTVGVGERKRVWWNCPNGHSYQSAIADRTGKKASGCPYCGKVIIVPGINDPRTLNPEIAAQWDEEKNGSVRMESFLNTSTYKAWWICKRGHSYQARMIDRIYNKTGCPYCAGKKAYPGFNDLASQRIDLAKEWDAELNAPLTAEMVTLGSAKRVWWRCQEGHVWRTAVFNRAKPNGSGCPECQRSRKGKAQQRYDGMMKSVEAAAKQGITNRDRTPDQKI